MKPPVFSCLSSRVLNNGSLYGRFLFGPLPIDISLTIATILRRSLLHTQANLYITSAEIEGATHEYASLPGIQESVLEILLNLGEIVLARKKQNLVSWAKDLPSSVSFFGNTVQTSQSPLTALLHISGPCVVKAKDINWPEGVWCVKPNMPIATLSNNQTLAMRLKIMPLFKQNSSNSFGVAENSESFSTNPNELGSFRTESLNRELKSKDSTLSYSELSGAGASSITSALAASEDLAQKTTGLPLWGQVVPTAPRISETLKEVMPSSAMRSTAPIPTSGFDASPKDGSLGQTKPSMQNQKSDSQINKKFWSSKSLWGPFKASGVSVKNEGIDFSTTSIKKAGEFATTKEKTNTMLVEDREKQGVTVRSPLLKWNKEGFLLRQSKEIETLTNNKEYVSPKKASLPRQLNFAQTNSTKLDPISTSGSYRPSFEPKDFGDKTLGKELRVKSSTYIESTNKIKGIELVVSPSTYPVEKVNFLIERDDQLAGYRHRIIFEVWTNGSISPRQAIFDSIGWVLKLLYNFRQPAI